MLYNQKCTPNQHKWKVRKNANIMFSLNTQYHRTVINRWASVRRRTFSTFTLPTKTYNQTWSIDIYELMELSVLCACACMHFLISKISVENPLQLIFRIGHKKDCDHHIAAVQIQHFICLHSMHFQMKMVSYVLFCLVTLFLLPFTIQLSTFFLCCFLCDTFATLCANKQAYASKGVLICIYTHTAQALKQKHIYNTYIHKADREKE